MYTICNLGGKRVDSIVIKAMAKVNLGLDVLRRRENGYHDVKMVMQTVNLYDTLTLSKIDEGIVITTNTGELPLNEDNLIYKAAKLLLEYVDKKAGVSIHLDKQIPIAAGMAGGSTDAASTLLGINELYNLDLTKGELAEVGVKIGADVPYCIYGGTYLSEGIGEVLTKLPDAPDCYVVIAKPGIGVSTKYVYENLHIETVEKHPDIDGMIDAIKTGSLDGVTEKMENVLETVTIKRYPEIETMKKCLLENGAENALMSGSGPTVFGIFKEEKIAKQALSKLQKTGLVKNGFVTTFVKETGIIE